MEKKTWSEMEVKIIDALAGLPSFNMQIIKAMESKPDRTARLYAYTGDLFRLVNELANKIIQERYGNFFINFGERLDISEEK